MTKKNAEEILARYNAGKATPEEVALVESWYLKYKTPPTDLHEADLVKEEELGLQRLRHAIDGKRRLRLWRIAAAAILLIGVSWFGLRVYYGLDQAEVVELAVAPNTEESVILTLSNGKRVVLSADHVGKVIGDASISIQQSADGELVYTATDKQSSDQLVRYNTIETPRGRQYKVVLPDGSVVYLSAQSSLRYPLAFSREERKVVVTGQAHFDIVSLQAGGRRVPFRVEAGKQIIEVMGTQFNICAYPDEEFIETALLEGKVKVAVKGGTNQVILKPGQLVKQHINTGKLTLEEVDINDLQAWKEGYFIFNNENIKDIMRKLARWYGLDVAYVGNMEDVSFQGNYLRTKDVGHLLKTLELSNQLNFEITETKNERRVVVKRK